MTLPQRRTRLLKDIQMLLNQHEFIIAAENVDKEHLIDDAFTLRITLSGFDFELNFHRI
jgi:hypothetical protein